MIKGVIKTLISHAMLNMVFIVQLGSSPKKILDMIIKGEESISSFKSVRETNKRIIYFDKQGRIGKKIRICSIPLKSILMFSSENVGLIELTTEFQIWAKIGTVKMSFSKKCDIHKISQLMAERIL